MVGVLKNPKAQGPACRYLNNRRLTSLNFFCF
jgi:hypothetical protein